MYEKHENFVESQALTNPETHMYSNTKTITNGAMKLASVGINFNFAFKPLNFTSYGGMSSDELLFDSIVAMSTDFGSCFRGDRNKNQKVAA